MVDPNADVTAEGDRRDEQAQSSPASPACHRAPDAAAPEAAADQREEHQVHHGEEPKPSQGPADGAATLPLDDENDCTPRSEVPSVPDALNASLLSQIHTLDPEPSYFSPQPLRVYSSPLPRDSPASTNPSPSTSAHSESPASKMERPKGS